MGIFASDFDSSQVKEFYDPHPGFIGALFSLPMEVKEVVDQLNGQSMSLREAMNRIRVVTKDNVGVGTGGDPQVKFITLEVVYGGPYDVAHTFCVIKYR